MSIFGISISADVIIVSIAGGIITWYFGVLLKNKETFNKSRESFINEKIQIYNLIRESVAEFADRDFIDAEFGCTVLPVFFDTKISFSKLLQTGSS